MSTPTPLFQQPAATPDANIASVSYAKIVPHVDVQMIALVESLDRIDVEEADSLETIEAHLRVVEVVIASAEQILGKPVGTADTRAEKAAERMVTELYRYRRMVRSRRGQLMDRVRQEGSSPRQRALRRLAEQFPVQYRVLLREERERAAS